MAAFGPAYKLLRDRGMSPQIARYFLSELRSKGFVLVKESEILKGKKIEKQMDILIKLMKAKRSRK